MDQHQQRGVGVGVEQLERLGVDALDAAGQIGLRRIVQQAAGAQQHAAPGADRIADAAARALGGAGAVAGIGLGACDLAEQGVLPHQRIELAGQRLLELVGIGLVDVQAACDQLLALRLGLEQGAARHQQVAGGVAQGDRHRMTQAQDGGGELNDSHEMGKGTRHAALAASSFISAERTPT